MLIRTILILNLVFMSWGVLAQSVKVVDRNTGAPIENVMIYNLSFTRAVPTDREGEADLSDFPEDNILLFQHPSYHDATFPMNSLTGVFTIIELEEKIISIDEMIISASRWEQDPEEIANTVATMKSREIELKNPATSADLLQESGQVFVQKSQLGGGSPMIRGFSANSVLLVVDGVRMNNAIYRSGNLQNVINIDVNSLQEAEVLFGPGSVMYGSDALGGVMDFHVKNPVLSPEKSIRLTGNGFLRYASAAGEKTGHLDLNIGSRKFGSFTSFSITDFDDLRAGANRPDGYPDFGKRPEYVTRINDRDTIVPNENVNIQKFSNYNQYSLIQKFTYRPLDYYDINYGFYYSNTSSIPRYDRLILYNEAGLPENAEWYYGPQTWMMNKLQLRSYRSRKGWNEARITFAHQFYEESRHDRGFRENLKRSRFESVDLFSLNIDIDKTFNDRHQLFYGLDAAWNQVDSEAERLNIETGETSPASTRYPDGGSEYYFAALYANYQWKLTKKTGLNGGLRYTFTGLDARIEDINDLGFTYDAFSNRNGAFNGSIGLVHKLSEASKIDVVLSSGFRAPNVDDVGKLFDSAPGIVVVPNKDLQPEYTYNLEAGLTHRINEKLQVHGVAFYTFLEDAMVRRNFTFNGEDSLVYDGELSRVQALVNTGRARIYGFNLLLKGDISTRWGIMSSLNYTQGKDLEDGEPIRHAPPLFGETALYYKNRRLMGEMNIRYSGGIPFEDLAPSERDKPHLYTEDGALPWYTLNLKTSYRIGPHIMAQLGIENILDLHYRPYSSGISAPGRNVIIGLRASF